MCQKYPGNKFFLAIMIFLLIRERVFIIISGANL